MNAIRSFWWSLSSAVEGSAAVGVLIHAATIVAVVVYLSV